MIWHNLITNLLALGLCINIYDVRSSFDGHLGANTETKQFRPSHGRAPPETGCCSPSQPPSQGMSAAAGVSGGSVSALVPPLCWSRLSLLGTNAGDVLITAANFSGDFDPYWAHWF